MSDEGTHLHFPNGSYVTVLAGGGKLHLRCEPPVEPSRAPLATLHPMGAHVDHGLTEERRDALAESLAGYIRSIPLGALIEIAVERGEEDCTEPGAQVVSYRPHLQHSPARLGLSFKMG